MKKSDGRHLPDREIAYNYTAAMLFGQEIELNMKALLHTINYSFSDLEDTLQEDQIQRFKTFDQFLVKATAGSLQEKMLKAGVIWPKEMWKLMNEAIATRNYLAHEYLEQLNLPPPNEEQHEAIIHDLNTRIIVLYRALIVTRETRNKLEKMSEDQHDRLNNMMRELGINPMEINKGLWRNKDKKNKGKQAGDSDVEPDV